MTNLRYLIPLLFGTALAHAEARLEFVDIRAQAGLVENRNAGGGVTLMCGNIGTKNQGGDEMPDDSGIVLGVRGSGARVKAYDGDEAVDTNIASLGVLGGLGYYLNKREHVELVAGYALGRVTLLDDHSGFGSTDGHSNTITGELGWYHTWKKGLQLGILGGWSLTRFHADREDGTEISARSAGVNIATSIGYRF